MAEVVSRIDDLTGNLGALERHFSIESTDYAIDLTNESWNDFLTAIEPYRSAARVARKTRKSRTPELTKEDRDKIRKWAEANGTPISAKGRFPIKIIEDYLAEHEHELVGV